jgi:probable selenium-dependent hydroxylase accessory protein YqeC
VGERVARALPTVLVPSLDDRAFATDELERNGVVFAAREVGADGKYLGVDPELPRVLVKDGAADVAVVEADGARQRSLKAPAEHEPVLPSGVHVVCPMAGLDVLGRKITEASVHRPELLRTLVADAPAEGRSGSGELTVTPEIVAAALTSPHGGFKGIPAEASVCPILNKASLTDPDAGDPALQTALLILEARPERIERVLVTDICARLLFRVERPREPRDGAAVDTKPFLRDAE